MSRPRTRRPPSEASTRIRGIEDDDDVAVALLPPLDGNPGPARRLSSARFAQTASAIADAAQKPVEVIAPPTATIEPPTPPPAPVAKPRRRRAHLALGVMLAVIVVAGAIGVWATQLS